MILELLVGTAMVLLTVVIHATGLTGLGWFLRLHHVDKEVAFHPLSPKGFGLTLAVVLALFVLHGLEIWAYAMLFLGVDAIGDARTAIYFSTTSYAAIGYSDSEIVDGWKLVGAIEGINGLLLLGWSTAFFVTVMNRFRQ